MKFKIIDDLAIFFDNTIPEKYLSKLQEFLLSGAIFTDATKVLAMIVIFIIISEIVLALTLAVLNFPVSLLILPFYYDIINVKNKIFLYKTKIFTF